MTQQKRFFYFLLAGAVMALSTAPVAYAIDTSLSSSGASVSGGALNDNLFYSIGGGSVISPPPGRNNMARIGLDGGWSSDLMCGNFDLSTTVGNQLNGITSGFKDLQGRVIQGATGAVMSMPAMAIQRANPGLYEMLTNGIVQAGLSFDKALLNCLNMSKKLADYTMGNKWQQAAVAEEYKNIVATSGGDATASDQKLQQATGEEGVNWIGGEKRGGKGQPAIQPTHDLAKAGYNMMNGQPVNSNSPVSTASCNGTLCERYKTPEEAAAAVVKVVGDGAIRTCRDTGNCASGGTENQPGTAIAGTGFSPVLEEATKENLEQLSKLASGQLPPTAENLAKLKAGNLPVTRGVIQALRDDPDRNALVQRLASELAMADTVEMALGMRRMLVTGQSEPNAAQQPLALEEGDRRIEAIDRELNALKTEMEVRKAITSNGMLTALERQNMRNQDNQLQQRTGSQDKGFGQMEQSAEGGAK